MNTLKLNIRMLTALRGRRGLDENNDSQDEKIFQMKPEEIVRECSRWYLGCDWATDIAHWMVAVGAKPDNF